jgi:hypothetical protein
VKLPDSIKVGYREFSVVGFPFNEAAARGRLGECLLDMGLIRIRDDLQGPALAMTLVHEVMHAAFGFGCLTDEDGEERTIAVLANVWCQIVADNPDFHAFLSESLTGSASG